MSDEPFFGVVRTLNEDTWRYDSVERETERYPLAYVQYTSGERATAFIMVPLDQEQVDDVASDNARRAAADMRDVQVTHVAPGWTVYEGYVRDMDGEHILAGQYHRERWDQYHPPVGYAPHEHKWVTTYKYTDPFCAVQGCPADPPI